MTTTEPADTIRAWSDTWSQTRSARWSPPLQPWSPARAQLPSQPSFEDLEPTLRETTFVVVDLETTGGSSRTEAITEIGAVKVRGGEVLGEFSTLVDPGRSIPPQIVLLTGITDAMLVDAPRENSVIPSFLEFARGAVLVAHNAPFDIGFLRAACGRLGIAWPAAPVLDTVRLARTVFSRNELPSVRLGVLAAALGARVTPNHRALADAQATVDVLHALIERLGPLGVETLSELVGAQRAVDPARRRKRHLADHVPAAPGVYLFRSSDDDVLYVGTSGNLRSRVRSYFTAAETRGRIKEMVLQAARVDYVVCATRLEAAVREQRLIVAHQPRYNRRSKRPARTYWLRIGPAPSHRLTLTAARPETDAAVGESTDRSAGESAGESAFIGPFSSRTAGRMVADAVRSVRGAAEVRQGRVADFLDALRDRMETLARENHFAAAAQARDQLATVIRELEHAERLAAFTGIAELITAAPDGAGGWEITVIRRGRLVSAGVARRGVDPMPVVGSLVASAETIPLEFPDDAPAASTEESATILAHVEEAGVRIVRSSSGWSLPVGGFSRWRPFAERAAAALDAAGYEAP
jgi:DNA polymerase-3 subunit epsilon